jgi:hypothetical protein
VSTKNFDRVEVFSFAHRTVRLQLLSSRTVKNYPVGEPMLLDSAVYLVFLLLVVVIYWRLKQRHQNIMLLCASYFF